MKKKLLYCSILLFILSCFSCEADKDFTKLKKTSTRENIEIDFAKFKTETKISAFALERQLPLSGNSLESKISDLSDFTILTENIIKHISADGSITYAFLAKPENFVPDQKEVYNLVYYQKEGIWEIALILLQSNNTETSNQFDTIDLLYTSRSGSPTDYHDCMGTRSEYHCTHTGSCSSGSCDGCTQCVTTTVIFLDCGGSGGGGSGGDNGDDGNYGGGGNADGNGEDFEFGPILPEVSAKPCKDLAAISKPDQADMVAHVVYLKAQLDQPVECAVEIEKRVHPTQDGAFLYPPTDKDGDSSTSVEISTGGSIIGAAHSHPVGVYAIPSFGDLKWLLDCHQRVPNFRKKDVFTIIVCEDFAGVKSTYAIKISNLSDFMNKINTLWNDSELSQLGEKEKLKILNDRQGEECKKTNGQYGQLEKSFLQMYSGFGFDLLKATNNNLDNWVTLKLDSSAPTGVKSIPCN